MNADLADQPIWKNGAFLRLWIAQALTQTAQNAIWYALLVLVEEVSQSSTQLGITILSVILPSVLFGVPAGAYVDRWDKRKVLVITNIARCIIVLGYMAFASTLGLLYLISFLFSIVSQFFAPAETSMIPAIAGPRRLMQANSFFHLTFTASQFIGLVFVGPLLVKLAGLTTFFIAMAVLFAVSSFLVWRLPPQPPAPDTGPELNPVIELVGQLKEVMGLVLADRRMLAAMGYLTLGMTLTLVVAMLAPHFATGVLGLAADNAVIVLAPAGIGMLTGAFVLSRASGALTDRQRIITTGFTVVSLALGTAAGLPTIMRRAGLMDRWDGPILAVVMISALLAGLGFAGIVVASQTLLQERAPRHALARVFAVQLTLGNSASILPLLLIGGLADLFGVGYVLLVVAVLVMVVAFLSTRHGDARQPAISDA